MNCSRLGWVGRSFFAVPAVGAASALVGMKSSVSHWCYCIPLQGHSSYITHLDWSPDNKYIMSNSGDYEILYCKYGMKSAGNRKYVLAVRGVCLIRTVQNAY